MEVAELLRIHGNISVYRTEDCGISGYDMMGVGMSFLSDQIRRASVQES